MWTADASTVTLTNSRINQESTHGDVTKSTPLVFLIPKCMMNKMKKDEKKQFLSFTGSTRVVYNHKKIQTCTDKFKVTVMKKFLASGKK